jgi:hypothetical protein
MVGPDKDAGMSGWYSAPDAKEIPEGSMKGIEVGEAKILLVAPGDLTDSNLSPYPRVGSAKT